MNHRYYCQRDRDNVAMLGAAQRGVDRAIPYLQGETRKEIPMDFVYKKYQCWFEGSKTL